MVHNTHPSTDVPALTWLSKEPRQNYSQVESLGCPGPTGEGGCEQTFLSHTPLQLWLTAMPKQELITDPGTQSILGMQLGVTACTPWIDSLLAHSHGCCSNSTMLFPIPAHPAELGSALTHAVSAQFPIHSDQRGFECC